MTAKKKKTAANSPLDSYWDIGKLIVPGSSRKAKKVLNTVPFDPDWEDPRQPGPPDNVFLSGSAAKLGRLVNELGDAVDLLTRELDAILIPDTSTPAQAPPELSPEIRSPLNAAIAQELRGFEACLAAIAVLIDRLDL